MIRRLISTFKRRLLRLRSSDAVEELHRALREFAERSNNPWAIGRIGYRMPTQTRHDLLADAA